MAALIPVNTLGVNVWPASVFTSAKNFRIISLKSVGLTVLRSTVIFLFRIPLSELQPASIRAVVLHGLKTGNAALAASLYCKLENHLVFYFNLLLIV